MAKPTGSNGLMGMWADIDAEDVLRFQEWHNCEHIPERVSIPGFNTGRRYRGMKGAPTFFMVYETDDAAVLASAPYHERLNNPTPWTRESLALFRNADRNIFSLEAVAGALPTLEPPYVYLLRFNLESEGEDETLAWLAEAWLPAIGGLEEIHRARLYRLHQGISGMMTSERKIYDGVPGELKYLALCETTAPRPGESEAWLATEKALAGAGDRLPRRRDLSALSYWLEIAFDAPDE
ncbi:MAG: hypothetical protein V3S64_17450 [bacterium]